MLKLCFWKNVISSTVASENLARSASELARLPHLHGLEQEWQPGTKYSGGVNNGASDASGMQWFP